MVKLSEIFEMIIENKDWLFSGIGNTIGGALISNMKKKESIDSYVTNVVNYNVDVHDSDNPNRVKLDNNVNNEIYQLVDRIISIYQNHGLEISQIPSFTDSDFNFKLSDFKDKNSILEILDNKFIDWTCNMFGVERDWVDGKSSRIYKHINYYKNIRSFMEEVFELKSLHGNELDVFLIKSGELSQNEYGENYVIILVRYPIKKINNTTIYKYMPISTNWDWGYWRSRYQLKAIIYICEKLNIFTHSYDMSLNTMYKISSGLVFPQIEIDKLKLGYTWYPEDYIDYTSDNIQAKETEETDMVRKYFEDEGYLKSFKELKDKYKYIL